MKLDYQKTNKNYKIFLLFKIVKYFCHSSTTVVMLYCGEVTALIFPL